mgnify:CR=1 FL=1
MSLKSNKKAIIKENLMKLTKGSNFYNPVEHKYTPQHNDILLTRDGKRVILFSVSNARYVCDMDITRIFNHIHTMVISYPLDVPIKWDEYDLTFSQFGGVGTVDEKYAKVEMECKMSDLSKEMDHYIPGIQDKEILKKIVNGETIPEGTIFYEDWERVPYSHEEFIKLIEKL